MANYKEIVTKAVISKGKRLFSTNHSVEVSNPSTILGCWVINHNFEGKKQNNSIIITGSYDVNIWYSSNNDTKTDVLKRTDSYQEVVHMREVNDITGEEIIVRSLKQPTCTNVEINGDSINYTIEKELGIELVGEVLVKIETSESEDNWDDIVEDNLDKEIDNIREDYIDENTI